MRVLVLPAKKNSQDMSDDWVSQYKSKRTSEKLIMLVDGCAQCVFAQIYFIYQYFTIKKWYLCFIESWR